MILINVPIEPLEERYSIQWNKWFSEAFYALGIPVWTILPETTSGKINRGSFLDVLETNQFKTQQLFEIINLLEVYDGKEKLVIFFHDLWNPALITLAYIRDGMGWKNMKLVGCLHAGAYDRNDFLFKKGMAPWAGHVEIAMFDKIADEIYVATEYHKQLLEARVPHSGKIKVTGFPIFPEFVPKQTQRRDLIVFPHRLDEEKHPDVFDRLAAELKEEADILGLRFVKTKEEAKNKEEYYKLLSRAKIAISCAKQETWGIAMQEAILCGAIPICPADLSYLEMYPQELLYINYEILKKKVIHYMVNDYDYLILVQDGIKRKGSQAIPNIINLIKNL
jgi:glycosyltransferase involved in cell wall biosynthesis